MPTLIWDQKEKPVRVPVKAPIPRQVWLSSHKIENYFRSLGEYKNKTESLPQTQIFSSLYLCAA